MEVIRRDQPCKDERGGILGPGSCQHRGPGLETQAVQQSMRELVSGDAKRLGDSLELARDEPGQLCLSEA